MDCKKAIELLPSLAMGALSDQERAELEKHLGVGQSGAGHFQGGCPSCQRELDELMAAASLLAESVEPIAPRPEVKLKLFQRIENEKLTPSSVSLSDSRDELVGSKRGWPAYMPFVAATLCAVAAGSWVAGSVSSQVNDGGNRSTASMRADALEWKRRLAVAERTFGPPRIQLAKLEADATGQGLAAAVFCDGLAGELHVLLSNISSPAQGRQLWLWLVDREGNKLAQGPLAYLGNGHAAGLIDFPAAPETVVKTVFEVIITDELPSDHEEPTGPIVGQARVSKD